MCQELATSRLKPTKGKCERSLSSKCSQCHSDEITEGRCVDLVSDQIRLELYLYLLRFCLMKLQLRSGVARQCQLLLHELVQYAVLLPDIVPHHRLTLVT